MHRIALPLIKVWTTVYASIRVAVVVIVRIAQSYASVNCR
jgi:hypothetical protein